MRVVPRTLNRRVLSTYGLTAPGVLWTIVDKVDLTDVQSLHIESWKKLKPQVKYGSSTEIALSDAQESFHNLRELLGEIFLSIIRSLNKQGRTELADAVWHSIAKDQWCWNPRRCDRKHTEFCDSSKDIPDPVLGRPELMMQLDFAEDGSLHHEWMIERIMRDGGLWSGRAVKTSIAPVPSEEGQSTVTDSREADTSIYGDTKPNLVRRKLARAFLPAIARAQAVTADLGDGPDLDMGALTDFLHYTTEPQDRSPCEAFFDVVGPSSILTCYDAYQERIPHPQTRSMSNSWIVKPAPSDEVPEDHWERNAEGRYKTVGIVKGMWKIQLATPLEMYTVV